MLQRETAVELAKSSLTAVMTPVVVNTGASFTALTTKPMVRPELLIEVVPPTLVASNLEPLIKTLDESSR